MNANKNFSFLFRQLRNRDSGVCRCSRTNINDITSSITNNSFPQSNYVESNLSRCFTTNTSNRINEKKNRPMVHLSSAPNVKFKGHKIGSSYPITPHTITPKRNIPASSSSLLPPYAINGNATSLTTKNNIEITIHDHLTIDKIRKASQLAAKMLQKACQLAQQQTIVDDKLSFMTTDEIDDIIHNEIINNYDAYPSPLNYHHYPKSICTSINEIVCHGIPDTRRLQNGDLLSIDISIYLNGVHGDNCTSVIIGGHNDNEDNTVILEQKERANRLTNATKEALYEAINICTKDTPINHIGHVIHDIADQYGYRPMKHVCGHGIGADLHMYPPIQHYRNNKDVVDDIRLQPGMVITIEPVLVEGHHAFATWDDGWTITTMDGGLAAQFEHTVLITDYGPPEVLTLVEDGD